MNLLKRTAVAAALLLSACGPVAAQWQTPNHSVPIGRGAGATGFGGVQPGAFGNVLTSNGPGADPSFNPPSAPGGGGGIPSGRLTLAPSSPIMSSSQTAATNVYYAPYVGSTVPIYNGATVQGFSFTVSNTDTVGLVLPLGASWSANANYDAFAFQAAGTVSLCTGPDWGQGTVAGSNAVGASLRGTGAGSTELQLFQGVFTNKNAMTCRTANTTVVSCAVNQCTYLGSFRTGAAGQVSFTYGTQGGAGTFNVWNAYNQAQFCSTSSDGTLAITGTSSATPQQLNNSAVNQFNFMTGLATNGIDASANTLVRMPNVANSFGAIGLAMNSTTTVVKSWRGANNQAVNLFDQNTGGTVTFQAVLGPNFVSMNQQGDGTNVGTYFGQNFQTLRVCVWQ